MPLHATSRCVPLWVPVECDRTGPVLGRATRGPARREMTKRLRVWRFGEWEHRGPDHGCTHACSGSAQAQRARSGACCNPACVYWWNRAMTMLCSTIAQLRRFGTAQCDTHVFACGCTCDPGPKPSLELARHLDHRATEPSL